MKIGIFSVVDHYPKELPRTVAQFYAELLDHVQRADELNFDSFWIAEHHFHEYGAIPAPATWLAAAAMRTRQIGLGVAISVLPFHNPLLVAEEYAMVDVLSGGRLQFGVGSGYLQHEFKGFGVPFPDKYARFDEALDIINLAWKGELFSYRGRFNQIDNVALQITPLQKPLPPITIAVLRNEAARQVGERGYPLMTIPYATNGGLSELAQMVSEYRGAYAESGHGSPSEATTVCAVHAYVADDAEGIEHYAKPAIDRYVRTRLYAVSRPYELLQEKKLIACGNAQHVVSTLKAYEAAGFDRFLCMLDFGGLEHGEVERSMKRFARDVLPAFT